MVLQGTAMRLSDLLLTTLLLDWPSLGEMKPQPRQAVDPRSETGASEKQLQYLCLLVGTSKMNVSSRAEAICQESPQDFPLNEVVCTRDVGRMSMDLGHLDTLSETVPLYFGCP